MIPAIDLVIEEMNKAMIPDIDLVIEEMRKLNLKFSNKVSLISM